MARIFLIASGMFALFLSMSWSASARPGSPLVDVAGVVTLVQSNSHRPARDASQVVVWLVPSYGGGFDDSRENSAGRHYRMLQHDKTFDPKLLVVPLGSIVDFPNLDPWFHNVFSLYQGKRFDLGLYQAGAEKQVVFDRPGPSFLFCNIHPQMTAVILVVNSEFFGISDKAGHISIPHVPAGRYSLHVWYENAASGFTDVSMRPIDISPENGTLPEITVPVTKRDWTHKNKYGQEYDTKATAPAY